MKKYLVIGMGNTGISIIEFLKKNSANEIIAFDTRAHLDVSEIKNKFPTLQYALGGIDVKILNEIDELVVSPGVSLTTPVIAEAIKQGLPVIGDIELFYQHAQAPIIGITGTNAKSTVTTLVTDMINAAGVKAVMGGNIGVPALQLLDQPLPDYYVLELSSFQLELTRSLSCFAGVVLNVSPNHLDRHFDVHTYQQIKERLYLNCRHPVYYRGMQYLQAPIKSSFSFDLDEPLSSHDFGVIMLKGERYLAQGHQPLFKVAELGAGLQGEHNVLNALSALALTAPLKLEVAAHQVLKNFQGLPHRCVGVRTLNGVRWINDSKGTTIGATEAGIKGIAKQMKGRLILILGGIGKGQDFNLLRPIVEKYVAHTIIFGADQALIASALHDLSYNVVADLDAVIAKAYTLAQPGDVVFFSPACASYDMFKNFEQRGEIFTQKVNALGT